MFHDAPSAKSRLLRRRVTASSEDAIEMQYIRVQDDDEDSHGHSNANFTTRNARPANRRRTSRRRRESKIQHSGRELLTYIKNKARVSIAMMKEVKIGAPDLANSKVPFKALIITVPMATSYHM